MVVIRKNTVNLYKKKLKVNALKILFSGLVQKKKQIKSKIINKAIDQIKKQFPNERKSEIEGPTFSSYVVVISVQIFGRSTLI